MRPRENTGSDGHSTARAAGRSAVEHAPMARIAWANHRDTSDRRACRPAELQSTTRHIGPATMPYRLAAPADERHELNAILTDDRRVIVFGIIGVVGDHYRFTGSSNSSKIAWGDRSTNTSESTYVTRWASGARSNTNFGVYGVKVQQYSACVLSFDRNNSSDSTSSRRMVLRFGAPRESSTCLVLSSRPVPRA